MRQGELIIPVPFQKDPVRLIYYEQGSGQETVLGLPGFSSSGRSFFDIFRYLSQNYRTVAIDPPGFGRSPPLESSHSISRYADLIPQVLESLGIDRAYLCGISMGGTIAFVTAMRYPNRVKAIAAAGTPYLGDEILSKELQIAFGMFLAVSFPFFLYDELTRKFTFRLSLMRTFLSLIESTDLATIDPKIRKIAAEDIKAFNPRAATDMMWDMFNIDLRAGLLDLKVPVLLVDGDSIPYRGLDTIDRLAKLIPHGLVQTHRIRGSGHLAAVLHPKEFAQRVHAFFQSHAPSSLT